jgi:hypothetical protein
MRANLLPHATLLAGVIGASSDTVTYGTMTEQRLHQLIRQPKPISDRELEIEFLDPGVAVFAFTFG